MLFPCTISLNRRFEKIRFFLDLLKKINFRFKPSLHFYHSDKKTVRDIKKRNRPFIVSGIYGGLSSRCLLESS